MPCSSTAPIHARRTTPDAMPWTGLKITSKGPLPRSCEMAGNAERRHRRQLGRGQRILRRPLILRPKIYDVHFVAAPAKAGAQGQPPVAHTWAPAFAGATNTAI